MTLVFCLILWCYQCFFLIDKILWNYFIETFLTFDLRITSDGTIIINLPRAVVNQPLTCSQALCGDIRNIFRSASWCWYKSSIRLFAKLAALWLFVSFIYVIKYVYNSLLILNVSLTVIIFKLVICVDHWLHIWCKYLSEPCKSTTSMK